MSGVEHWTGAFARLDPESHGAEPLWLRATRKAALARFEELGFPTRRHEEWRYTNVVPLAETPFVPVAPRPGRAPARDLALVDEAPLRMVFVNGHFTPELSRLEGVASGVEVGSLASLLESEPGSLEPVLARVADFEHHPFTALNTAFFQDGAFVHVGPGTDAPAIALVFLSVPGQEPLAMHPRILVVLEPSCRATLLEAYLGEPGGPLWTNAVSELELADNAQLEHVKLQLEGPETFHVASLCVRQGRHSRFTSRNLCLGGRLTRNDVVAAIAADGAECQLDGLYVTGDGQHVDNHTLIDHQRPHGTSRELYKGILTGASRAVFNGKIVVRRDAQKTDARQKNDNLLLSERAEIDTRPQLEIEAEDVRCSHGSTIGHLDEDALFYLRSRGLSENAGRALLMRGFASAVVSALPLPQLAEQVERLVVERAFGPLGEEA